MKLFPAFLPRLTPAALASGLLLVAGPPPAARAQKPSVRADSRQRLLAATAPRAPSRVLLLILLIQLAWDRTDDNPVAAIGHGRQSLRLAQGLRFGRGQCQSLLVLLGWVFKIVTQRDALTHTRQHLRTAQVQMRQALFTTKPSGPGPGPGLSLCPDIITRGHGGALRVASVRDQYAEFIVTLPA